MTPEASVVLLTYNGELYLPQVIEMLQCQKQGIREIIAIDSGSTDATLEILRRSPASLYQIPNSEFSHPKTRNMGAQIARSKYVVFLTQDATPADSCWLDQLLRPFEESSNVAGTFSRQIPRPGADLLEANDLTVYFKPLKKINVMPDDKAQYRKRIWDLIQFSNASSACDRDLLLENPFSEKLGMAEDQEWAKRMLELGYSFAYQPESVVLHSHEHSLHQKYQRNLQMGASFSQFLSPMLGHRRFPLGACLYHLYMDLRYVPFVDTSVATKLKWLVLSPLHRPAMHYAYWRGWNSALSRYDPIEKKVVNLPRIS